jgi:curved DNA-binding protein CbpA
MTEPPAFDPFELLGVDASADAATIDRAYKARIRYVHPDIAGPAALFETKRLNVAREWLLDPALRAQLPPPARGWRRGRREAPETSPPPSSSSPAWETAFEPRPLWAYDPLDVDPLAYDYGSDAGFVRSFLGSIRSLSGDERARVTYSLGDEPPVYLDDFRDRVSEQLWARSRALADAIARVWADRDDEGPPLLFPRGRVFGNGAVVAATYARWQILGVAIRMHSSEEERIDLTAARCTWPWEASIGHARYGPREREVVAFLEDASQLSAPAAERLARSWERHMGSYLYGRPGEDWFPGALDTPKPELVSARLAAVDASRIEPPSELHYELQHGFHCGLRLTAHMLALGGVSEPGRDFLRPWRESMDANPSFWDRAHWGMPLG